MLVDLLSLVLDAGDAIGLRKAHFVIKKVKLVGSTGLYAVPIYTFIF